MSIDQREAASKPRRTSSPRTSVAGRITVGLIPKVLEELEKLIAVTRFSTTDVVNRAISIYFLIDKSQRDGYEVVLRHSETGKERVVEII